MIVFEKIRNMSVWRFAISLAIISVILYVAFKAILLPKLMNSSIAVTIVKENSMDREYRDRVLKQMYDSYMRKMADGE